MDFLNKIYESNYFGIGLFAVISFLVVVFLIVLFFGKKDEKKRKLAETNKLNINNENAFKETSTEVPIDIKTPEVPNNNASINFMPEMNIEPVTPINYEEPTPSLEVNNNLETNLNVSTETPVENIPTIEPITLNTEPEVSSVTPIINVNNEVVNEPINEEKPIIPEPIITPVIEEPVNYNLTPNEPAKVVEPTKIDVNNIEPTIEPEIKPIIEEKTEPLNIIPTIVEEPVITDSYYQPKEEIPQEEVKVPDIDFDALAKSISDELDELEKRTEVKVTPMSEIEEEPANSLSSIYVAPPVNTGSVSSGLDLPTKKGE